MLGKTKMDTTGKVGARLQGNKLYKKVAQVQMIAFAVMHLILGVYFAFISSEYINHPGFATQIKEHRIMDQIFAIVCFALFVMDLRMCFGLVKDKRISVMYYVCLAVSAILPILYIIMSGNYITDAMVAILEEGYPEFLEGEDAGWMVYSIGVEFGAWANGGEITFDSDVVVDYLSRIGHEPGTWVEFADFNLRGLLAEFRADMNAWNKFELYAIINAVLSAVFAGLGVVFLPLKKRIKAEK